MPRVHTVAQGECLYSVAHAYGFSDISAIYDHADNADLRRARPNPSVLLPGDRVVIPDHDGAGIACATGRSHRFVKRAPRVRLELRLLDSDGGALAKKSFCLTVGQRTTPGRTDKDGRLRVPIPASAKRAELTVQAG